MVKIKLYRAPEKILHDCTGCYFENSENGCPEKLCGNSILVEEQDAAFIFDIEREDGPIINFNHLNAKETP